MTKTKSNLIYTKPVSLVLLLLPKPHKAGYIAPCSSLSFNTASRKTVSWTYKSYFSCDSKMSFIYYNL